jgi:hypothetical protein
MRKLRYQSGLITLLVILSSLTLAQTPDIQEDNRRLIETAKQNSKLMENLEYLCDVIGARLTGSRALKQANDWAAERMREYGLENVHLEEWTIPVGWERGRLEAKLITPREMNLQMASVAWTPGTRGAVTGPVVIFDPLPDNSDLDRFKGKLKNAILLTSAPSRVNHHPSRSQGNDAWNRRMGGSMHPHPEDDEEMTEEQRRMNRAREEFLKKEGAAALLSDAGRPQMLLFMFGGWRQDGSHAPLPTLVVTNEHYGMLYRLVKRNIPVTMRLNIENRFIKGPIKVYNTIGEIKGTEKPEELVICGAHLDSWDLGNGTVDNGTGSMVVLEAARLIKLCGLRPKRTIRFILFSGEEQGLHGAREHVKQNKAQMPKVSAVFVNDTGTGKTTGLGLHNNPQVQPVFENELPVLKELGVTRYNNGFMASTDHHAFYEDRVPAFYMVQDPADYFLSWHTQSDTYDKALKDDLIQSATVMALCAYFVAQRPEMLPRRAEQRGSLPDR